MTTTGLANTKAAKGDEAAVTAEGNRTTRTGEGSTATRTGEAPETAEGSEATGADEAPMTGANAGGVAEAGGASEAEGGGAAGTEGGGEVGETGEGAAAKVSRLPVYLIVAAIVLVVAGGVFTWRAVALRTADSASNAALVDTGATAEVTSAITTSLNKIFSYSYDKTEVTEKAAADALRGKALETYNQLFGQVRALAPQQKLVLTTRVVTSAVESLSGDRARLLVFLDQSATRADNSSTSAAASQLSVTAERQDGTWVIVELEPR